MTKIINVVDAAQSIITLRQAQEMCIMHQGEAYTYFDEGNTRFVFTNKDKTKVIKILKNEVGFNYNADEGEIYAKASDENKNKMAETKYLDGFIEQEFVMPIKWAGKKLTIAQRVFAGSCRNEVGFDKNDKLVCFDLDEFKQH